MAHIGRGLMAGAAATAVLSMLMIAKTMMGVMPELDLPAMISGMMGASDTPGIGWAAHIMIGVVGYGVAIALLEGALPGKSHVLHGVLIATGGWILMMTMLMPMAGAGFFGMAMGMMAPVMTFVLHVIFGAVLGGVFGMNATTHRSASDAIGR